MLTKYFTPKTKTKNDIVVERIVVFVFVVVVGGGGVVGSIDSIRNKINDIDIL